LKCTKKNKPGIGRPADKRKFPFPFPRLNHRGAFRGKAMKRIEKDNIENRKNIYKLWWEYLKRSDDYKAHCEKYPDAVVNSRLFGISYWGDPDDEELQKNIMKWERASCFGNVHKDSFEVWWKKFKQLPDEKSTIEELSPHIDEIIENANSSTQGRKSIKSTSKSLREYMEHSCFPYIYLRINADTFTTNDIKEIKRIIKSKKVDFVKRRDSGRWDFRYYTRTYFKKVGRIRYDELQRYLEIFDLRKTGMKWKDIFEKTYPTMTWDQQNARRSIHTEYEKAEKIIKNVEKGNFPGKHY
jgi:hypothetical protein